MHHIEPLEERFDLRLDDGNLLTCCSRHHRMADDGDILRDYLHELAEASPGGIEVSVDPCQDQQRPPEQDEV